MLRRISFAAAVLGAMAFGAAVAAPIAPQSEIADDGRLVTLAKKGGGGKGAKGGGGDKGGKHHHRRRHRDGVGVGGAILFGITYCAIQAENCADEYGSGTRRYYRCLRDAGC